jgi:putative ABC transport system substrate-binding protein
MNQGANMRRREFFSVLGGAAVAWPVVARAQQGERKRRIGVLTNQAAEDPEGQARLAAFLQGLQEHGWAVGRNLQIDYRWAAGGAEQARKNAADLVALAPDVILATGGFGVAPLQQATRTVPVVFASVLDPVGAGFVASLARPGGNATGFINFEYGMGGKWLELLKQVAPRLTRMAVLRDPAVGSGIGQLGSIQTAAPQFGVDVRPIDVRNVTEIERALKEFAREPNGGMIVTAGALVTVHRDQIARLAADLRLPAVYPYRFYKDGLMSYGPDTINMFRQAAGYVDRILKGEKPADLPVQTPTKFELVINLKTAKALGLTVPSSLLASADEVIE